MSSDKINLEEILQDCWITTLDNSKEVHAPTEDVKLAMIEFGKQLLELAAENAEIEERDYRKNPTKISNYGEEVCSEYEGIYYGVDKQSILNTIKQVE